MGYFIATVGLFLFVYCLIWLLIRLIKRKPKKQPALGLLVCFILIVAGVVMTPSSSENKEDNANKAKGQHIQGVENTEKDDLATSNVTQEPKAPIEDEPVSDTPIVDNEPRTEDESKEGAGDLPDPNDEVDSSSDGFTLMFGELVDANPNGGVDGNTLVIKAKIKGQITNELTIKQNYHNVENLVKKQGADQFDCIDYWAVADMTNGEEQKVVAFTVNSDVIKGIVEGTIVAIQLEDYVDDLFIHQSLKG